MAVFEREPDLVVRAQSAPWWSAVEILLIGRIDPITHKRIVVTSMGTEQIDTNRQIDSTFRLSMDDAQTLMDDLWQCGIRPTDGVDNPGELRATKAHLEDMRAMVFIPFGGIGKVFGDKK